MFLAFISFQNSDSLDRHSWCQLYYGIRTTDKLVKFENGPLLEPNLDDCEENAELRQFHIS